MNYLKPKLECIPSELKSLNQWVCWKLVDKGGPKPTKIPVSPLGTTASTTNPASWSSFADAVEYLELDEEVAGLGIVLQNDLIGIDLDKCRDPETGKIEDWAWDIITEINSYTEISPSGTGIRIFATGQARETGKRRSGQIEIYDRYSPRYLTVTGHRIGDHTTIQPRKKKLERLVERVLGSTPVKTAPAPVDSAGNYAKTVDEFLSLTQSASNWEKISKLWQGETADYDGDDSAADLALCSHLAFYCGPNPEKIDELFRQSGLYRDKWERDDYRDHTISRALEGKAEFYQSAAPTNPELVELYQASKAVMVEKEHSSAVIMATEDDIAAQIKEWKEKKLVRVRQAYTIAELDNLPEISWQIEEHFPANSFVVMYGASGSGKSFVALDMALSVATGVPLYGRFQTKKGPVCYIASEGGLGMRYRIQAWCREKGVKPENFCLITDAFDLTGKGEALDVIATCWDKLGCLPQLIVVDTLSRNFGAGDENGAKDMVCYCRSIDVLRKWSNGTVISIHHSGHKECQRERGHSKLRADADTMISVVRTEEGMVIKNIKQKDAEEFPAYTLTTQNVSLGDVSSMVLGWGGTVKEQRTTDKASAEIEKLLPVLSALPGTIDKAMTKAEIMDKTGLTDKQVRLRLDDGIKHKYVYNHGECGKPARYWRSSGGNNLVLNHTTLPLA